MGTMRSPGKNNGKPDLMQTYLDFEKPIAELESKVAELKALAGEQHSVSIEEELSKLERKAREALVETYCGLTPWQKTQVARHPERPHFRHYIEALVEDFTPLAGDRFFAEDQAIVGGIGRLSGRSVMVLGHNQTMAYLAHMIDDGSGDEAATTELTSGGFPTCSLAVFEYDGDWAELDVTSARLVAFHVGRA